jgi:hypothetical protein
MIPDIAEPEQAQPGTTAEPCGTASLDPPTFDYALSAVLDQLMAIEDHQLQIEDHQLAIARHFTAVKTLMEEWLP